VTTINVLLRLVLIYYVCLHAFYFLLLLIAASQQLRYHRGITVGEFRRIAESSLTLPVSMIIPAYNEATIIVGTIRNALELNYPRHEVIVVSDGSIDGTLETLIQAFNLRRVDKHGSKNIPTQEILGVYESPDHQNLVVVDKRNGQRADAINAAATFSRYPLLCIIDADCVLESDALLYLARPFLWNADVAAATGIVRPSNGLTLRNGKVVRFGLPRTMLGMNQEIEYARSFESARIGLCALHSMLSISGALMMIKKTWFEEVGGASPSAITDDIEFTIRLNRRIYDRTRSEYAEIVFAPDAVCYTETPEHWRQYASQRNRWQRGTLQALLRNWKMFLNPRYGITGLIGMPFFVVFEALSAVVEPVAWVLMVLTLVLGSATGREVLVLLYLAYILSVFLTLSMVVLTETTRLRAASWQDLRRSLLAIFLDSLGFHQFHLIARVAGTVQYLVLGRRDLGAPMQRIAPKPHPL